MSFNVLVEVKIYYPCAKNHIYIMVAYLKISIQNQQLNILASITNSNTSVAILNLATQIPLLNRLTERTSKEFSIYKGLIKDNVTFICHISVTYLKRQQNKYIIFKYEIFLNLKFVINLWQKLSS